MRRGDIDWVRVVALFLLIIFHTSIAFMPFGPKVFFITNDEYLEILWIPMSLLNIWRIPILFMVSGMGVYFAIKKRGPRQLLVDRTLRILIPLIFGFFFICPINSYFYQLSIGEGLTYSPNIGHLWFLGNIFIYVVIFMPVFFYFKTNLQNIFMRGLSCLFKYKVGITFLGLATMVEGILVNPQNGFASYAYTTHGFFLGMICFFFGFCFVCSGKVFWEAIENARGLNLIIASCIYVHRMYILVFYHSGDFIWHNGLESMCWMLAIFGYASKYLNKNSHMLKYLSRAVYPVYIIHMPVQYCLSHLIFGLNISPISKLFFLNAGIFGISFILFEIIKKLRWIRPLFGLKFNLKDEETTRTQKA